MPLFYRFARRLCIWIVFIFFNCKIEGLENIPKTGGFILVCNHRSFADPVFLAIKVKRQLVFMAKEELFKIPVLGFIIKNLGAFKVSRGTKDTGALDFAINTVNENKILALFPEGTRSKTGELGRPKSGVVVIASQTKGTILPAAIKYNGKLRFRKKITVRFGKPIDSDVLSIDINDRHSIKDSAKTVMDSIAELLNS